MLVNRPLRYNGAASNRINLVDYVSLIALDVLDVLDEEVFRTVPLSKAVQGRIVTSAKFQ